MARLERQTAVVTGAGRGLGRAIAAGLAGEGAKVWICARTRSELEKTSEQITAAGGEVRSREVDLAETDSCSAFIQEVLRESAVDVLVNNAGVLQLRFLEEVELDDWNDHLAVNLTAPYLLTRAVLPGMRSQGGSIINISSRAGVRGFRQETAYCATKFGLEGFTQALALEVRDLPISANTVTPGLEIKPTSLTERAAQSLPEKHRLSWNDPAELVPAFVLLAALRGRPSGCRFNAKRLADVIRSEGQELDPSRIEELAE